MCSKRKFKSQINQVWRLFHRDDYYINKLEHILTAARQAKVTNETICDISVCNFNSVSLRRPVYPRHGWDKNTLSVLSYHDCCYDTISAIWSMGRKFPTKDVRGYLHLNEDWVCQLAPKWRQRQMGKRSGSFQITFSSCRGPAWEDEVTNINMDEATDNTPSKVNMDCEFLFLNFSSFKRQI